MRNWYPSLPLQSKQILTIIVINALTLLVVSTLYFYNSLGSYQKNLLQQLEASSQIIAGNVTSSLLFQDPHAAQEKLQTLVKDEAVMYAGVYDNNKNFFANYDGTQHFQRPFFNNYDVGIYYKKGRIELVNAIYYDAELIGYIFLVKSTDSFQEQVNDQTYITLGVFVMSLLLAWILSAVSQRWLSKPIKDLAAVIQDITHNKDYSHRLDAIKHKDEIGALMESFNTMLDAVQERDSKLRSHGAELEDLINIKTRQLHQRSNYDSLTKLPNRQFLIEQLENQITTAKGDKSKIAVLFLDLDRFKIINDNLGHTIGDQVLKIASERLSKIIPPGNMVGRWGSDEFVIFLKDIQHKSEIEKIAQSVTKVLETVIQLSDRQFHISSSIGISLYPNNGQDAFTLLKHADISMYKAKERGAGNFAFYNDNMDSSSIDRLSMETKLRRAIEQQTLTMVYQPKVDIQKGELAGVEALIRWDDPELGSISPTEFIPLAEEIGLINKIGEFVIQTACRQHAHWLAMGLPPIRIAINLSPTHLSEPKIVEHILRELEFYHIEPRYLELEITEETFLDSPEQCKKNLALFNKFGIHISIDDFGTGYSCLSYLLDLPVSTLKIDGSFVQKLGTQPENDGIVNAIMMLGHGLGLSVVAECVETQEQLDFLAENGCDVIQGYYFSKPLSAEDLVTYVKNPNYGKQRKA